jgi:hypothetical protein
MMKKLDEKNLEEDICLSEQTLKDLLWFFINFIKQETLFKSLKRFEELVKEISQFNKCIQIYSIFQGL